MQFYFWYRISVFKHFVNTKYLCWLYIYIYIYTHTHTYIYIWTSFCSKEMVIIFYLVCSQTSRKYIATLRLKLVKYYGWKIKKDRIWILKKKSKLWRNVRQSKSLRINIRFREPSNVNPLSIFKQLFLSLAPSLVGAGSDEGNNFLSFILIKMLLSFVLTQNITTQLAGAVEYTDSISADG